MESYNVTNVAEMIMEAIQKERNNMKRLNVMVLGKTGVGKSTLINNMFSEPLAETGIGKPVTDRIRKYEKEGVPLVIYDTPGLELGGENAIGSLLAEVTEVIEDGRRSGDVNQAIHCVWYCVSAASHRFEKAEIDFIGQFLNETGKCNVPVILVLTQAFSKNDAAALKAEIEKEHLALSQIVTVLASDYSIDDQYVVKAYGLTRLAEVTDRVIPEAVKNTFVSVQKADLEMKRNKAHAVVVSSAAAAMATGAVPIPFADAALLIPEQVAMLALITSVFGIPVEKATITSVISATIGTMGATVLGKTVVAGLFKLIPGAGSVVGGAITGSVAAALTAALGEAYIAVMMKICRGTMKISDLETKHGKAFLEQLFREKLKLRRNEQGDPADPATLQDEPAFGKRPLLPFFRKESGKGSSKNEEK